jgi:predicted phosphodiesterase
MTLLHVTDPHFEFLPRAQVAAFGATCRALAEAEGAEVVVMTGDISTAARCDADMGAFLEGLGDGVLVAAVRGNHDFYGASIARVRGSRATTAGARDPRAPFEDPVTALRDGTHLVCVDGWYDFRCGSEDQTRLEMSDWHLIDELRGLPRAELVEVCRALAADSARRAINGLVEGLLGPRETGRSRRLVLATHVPPFLECALAPDGRPSDADWAPIMVNVALGDALRAFAAEHADVDLLVLCGHTHTACDRNIAPNLRVVVGPADYGQALVRAVAW